MISQPDIKSHPKSKYISIAYLHIHQTRFTMWAYRAAQIRPTNQYTINLNKPCLNHAIHKKSYFIQQLMLLVTALLFSGCSTPVAGIVPNTAVSTPVSIAALPTAQPTQPPAATAAAKPTRIATQPAKATMPPTVRPARTATALPSPIPTIVPSRVVAQPTAVPTQIATAQVPAVPTQQPASGKTMLLFLRQGNLWTANATGGNERQLAEDVADFAPSSNGALIAMLRGQGSSREIWLIARDGSGLRQLTRNNREEAGMSWAADGTALVTGSAITDEPYAREWFAWSRWCKVAEVHLIDIKTGSENSLAAGCDPAFAPDSKRIAYSAPPANLAAGFPADGPLVANAIRLINRQGQNGWNFAVSNGIGPESGGLLVYTPAWTPDSANVVYHRYMGMQVEVDINLSEIGRSFEGKGKPMAEGAGWLFPARFSETGDRVVLVKHDAGNARGLIGAGAWSLELVQLQGSREIPMPYGTLNAFGQHIARLNGAQAAAWAPGSRALAVLLPKGWAADGNPEAWGEEPGEIRHWVPGQAPAEVLVTQVDYGSPIAWLAP